MALESVEARIYIQGVAIFVVSPDSSPESQKVEVLIPDQEEAKTAGIHTCEHKVFAQFRHIEGDKDKKPLPLAGKRVRIRSNSKEMDLVADDGAIRGMPRLPEILEGTGNSGRIDPAILEDPFQNPRVLTHLTLDQGLLRPAAAFETRYKIPRASEGPIRGLFSNTILIELGQVTTFELELADLRTGEPESPIDLASTRGLYDEAEVWIRNFCEITHKPWFPMPPAFDEATAQGREDDDFVLNYALIENLSTLVDSSSLPIPTLETSWQNGDPIGLENRKCAPAQGGG